MESFKYILKKDKLTKNTIRYSEKTGERNQMVIYLQKSKLGKNPPDSIVLTVESNNTSFSEPIEINRNNISFPKNSENNNAENRRICIDCENEIPSNVYYCTHCGLKV